MAIVSTRRLHKDATMRTEMCLDIRSTENGAEYEFILRRKHIEVIQHKPPTKKDGKAFTARKNGRYDWNVWLTDIEKTQLFSLIMNEYRERSLGDNGFKGASVGVATDKRDGQSRLFIGINTQRWASTYFKHCAEQNMVNAATDTLLYERALNLGSDEKPEQKKNKPTAPEFKEVYVLQATDDLRTPISCPCGKCTDMLANVMVKNGQVITVPILTEEMKKKIKSGDLVEVRDEKTGKVVETLNFIKVNAEAKSLSEIKFPETSEKYEEKLQYEVWKTSIEELNRAREVSLKASVAAIQRDALKVVTERAGAANGLPEKRAQDEYNALETKLRAHDKREHATAGAFVEAFLAYIKESSKLISREIEKLRGSLVEPAAKAAENVMRRCKSEAVLDCVIDRDTGGINLLRMNQFMVDKITDTLADRMRSNKDKHGKIDDISQKSRGDQVKWVKGFDVDRNRENVTSIRCVVLQMDDGTFRYAVQADTKIDNAMPNAEVVALETATESLGRHGVRHVWAMEMNPKDVEKGNLRTSPKEGIERLMKRASAEGVGFHYIPFNHGNLTHERLKSIVVHLDENAIYPAGYKGAGIGTKDRRQQALTRDWRQFVTGAANAAAVARA